MCEIIVWVRGDISMGEGRREEVLWEGESGDDGVGRNSGGYGVLGGV